MFSSWKLCSHFNVNNTTHPSNYECQGFHPKTTDPSTHNHKPRKANAWCYCHWVLLQEPTFIPKIQIHFADFPYSHCSTKLEAANLGDLMRIMVRFVMIYWLELILTQHLLRVHTMKSLCLHERRNSYSKQPTFWVPSAKYSWQLPIREKR